MASVVITNKGALLLADMIAGTRTAKFTKIQLSSHDYSTASLEFLETIEDVKQEADFNSISVIDSATVKLSAIADNTKVTEKYYVSTIGLISVDNKGNSILYAVVDTSTEPDVQPAFDGTSVSRLSYTFGVQVGKASSVTINFSEVKMASEIRYDNTLSGLTSEDVQKAIDELAENGTGRHIGGSLIRISTKETKLFSKVVTLEISGATYNGEFDAKGSCEVSGVIEVGDLTVKSTDGTDTATGTLKIPYYGNYPIELSLTPGPGPEPPQPVKPEGVYGVEWPGTSTTKWTRTDDAESFVDPVPYYRGMPGTASSPFDNISPWSDMTVVQRSVGSMVKIPKYYYKLTKTGARMKLQVVSQGHSEWALANGFRVSPAHQNRGDGKGERDVIYVGRYHCASSNYRSTTGQTPKVNITRSAARQAISALGTTVWQYDYLTLMTIWILYLVEFADWNSQAKIGYGCGNNSAVQPVGSSESMGYHTGTMQTNRTTYGVGTQYRNIEGLWDNCYDWVDGIYFNNLDVMAIKNPSAFSDTTGGTKVLTRASQSNYISSFGVSTVSGFEDYIYPDACASTDQTYVTDYCDYGSGGVVLFAGGYYVQYQLYGLFYLYGHFAASSSDSYVGCRLLELP